MPAYEWISFKIHTNLKRRLKLLSHFKKVVVVVDDDDNNNDDLDDETMQTNK